MNPQELLYLPSGSALFAMCIVVFAASVVQAALGMGYGLTAAPLLALVDPAFVPVPTIIIGMITSTMGACSERHSINWLEVKLAVSGRLAGVIVAAVFMYFVIDQRVFMVVFGVGAGIAVLLSAFDLALPKTRASLLSMGAVSGLMGTITGVGAPPLALVYQGCHAGSARPTLAAIFAIGCFISIVALGLIGWIGKTELLLCAMMLPSMLAGTLAGRRLRSQFNSLYRVALLSVAGFASVLLVLKGVNGINLW